ncbi:hypothetical protein [Pseudoalteromonas luteoviolacea]|uniref:Big-1 domain-containing protein n=1 Tax=Pseudoalteromonas luteoviolacea H33 TaxID=1365251 RepID=A0A167EZG9_9GAMM|nr:hypothetical protein [Pseudoalteromonas luteoviolacea]KZN51407.1 hypothetical protein N476_13550 [Pseudoalteromonas luteoviolacea H33]KZN71422.1 hypothetical protein N477_03870 [Pseudoalteromonas luteoviolacea H33-S]MBQ4876778.1 hypothetical protein [Pseudoalteromonas luteoviolacea]MBQ4905433.1 hypothetical protein [Pseudoalteromonas luteoviolacea]
MGNKNLKLTKLALALGLTVGLTGCFSDNDNDVTITPPDPGGEQTVVVPPTAVELADGGFVITVTDSLGAPLPDGTSVEVIFNSSVDGLQTASGTAIAVTNTANDPYNTNTTGSFSYTVDGIAADTTKTFSFTVQSADFLSNTAEVSIGSGETLTEVVRLTARNFTSTDIPVVAETKALAELNADVTVEYSATGGLDLGDATEITLPVNVGSEQAEKAVGGAEVILPNGTEFVQANGEPLQSAPALTVAYFANEATAVEGGADSAATDQTSSLDAFPGGLNLAVADGGESVEGNFTTGGFVAIELVNEQGEKVKSFGEGKSIKVAMKVDKTTRTPCPTIQQDGESIADAANRGFTEAGVCKESALVNEPALVQVGQIFPVWSYEESNGQWSFESFGVVADDGNADSTTYNVEVEVDHLSYWNLDFFAQRGCNISSFNIVDSDGEPSTRFTSVQLLTNSYRFDAQPWNRAALNRATFRNPPRFDVEVRVLENNVNVLDGVQGDTGPAVDNTAAVYSGALCDLNGLTLQLTPTENVEVVTKPVSTFAVCSNNDDADQGADPVLSPTTVQLYRGAVLANNLQDSYYGSEFNIELDSGVEYTFRFFNTFTNTWETQVETGSTDALSLNMLTQCDTQTVTGVTGGN